MHATTRKTRVCTVETLDDVLKTAIRAHRKKFGLEDMESNVLMCCETISVRQQKGFLGGITTTLSAVYVTPKWLVWADSNGRNDVVAGAVQLKYIGICDCRSTTQNIIIPNQGLNITGRYTDKDKTGMTFIVLDSEADGQKFHRLVEKALSQAIK